jgi:hypothetical protein
MISIPRKLTVGGLIKVCDDGNRMPGANQSKSGIIIELFQQTVKDYASG